MAEVWIDRMDDVSTRVQGEPYWIVAARVHVATDVPFPGDDLDAVMGSVEAWLFVDDRHDETMVANFDVDGECLITGAVKNGVQRADIHLQDVRTLDGRAYNAARNTVTNLTVERPKK